MTRENSDLLVKIKRAIMSGRYRFSDKAQMEMDDDDLNEMDIIESIINAVAIYKKIRSTSPYRKTSKEYLYIIQSTNLDGIFIYTKGKFTREADEEIYYFLISAKRAI